MIKIRNKWFYTFFVLVFFFIFLKVKGGGGESSIWFTCCRKDCDFTPGEVISFGGKMYYCCLDGWSETSTCEVCINDEDCAHLNCIPPERPICNIDNRTCECYKPPESGCVGTIEFSGRCPLESVEIPLYCEYGEVCIYRISDVCVIDNTGKSNNLVTDKYYCIDKKPPYFVEIYHKPELNVFADDTFDPFPDYFIDMMGNKIKLTPDKIVIDKERIIFTSISRDEYNNIEISGIKKSYLNFTKSRDNIKNISLPESLCPNSALYDYPFVHEAVFGNLDVGWGNLSALIIDQAENNMTNSNYQLYIFLGARADQLNKVATNKLVFLKTYWDSINEVRTKTNNLGGKSGKIINCFGQQNKCIQIRDVVGKTDEFTDCLWIGPVGDPINVKIYNFKEIIDIDNNEKINPQFSKDLGKKFIIGWENIKGKDLKKIAICSKNDTGILVDLPFLISRNIKDGFQILPSTELRFSTVWQVEYGREQRDVIVECYLNPTIDNLKPCTIDEILNGLCNLESGQKCYCGQNFPCKQNTSQETINSCSVKYPSYFPGLNRIICKMYDPIEKGIRVEVWFNHEFYYLNGKILKNESRVFNLLISFVVNMMERFISLIILPKP